GNTEKPLFLSREEDYWTLALDLSEETSPVSYKYVIYDTQKKKFISYEERTNRILNGDLASGVTVLHDGFARFSAMRWRGAGVSIPVFSLRSQQSWGVGEFTDLRLLVDWAAKTGMKMIQILPVNDTTATYTWRDSYPYAAISAFALHPLYLNVTEVAGKKYQALLKPFQAWQQKINAKAEVQYEEVLKQKLTVLRELFGLQKDKFTGQKAFIHFFEKNRYWLVPYAVFCHLRDKYGTADFTRWKTHRTYSRSAIEKYGLPGSKHYEEIAFHYFLQYHLHLQLKAAAEYAHQHGVILKGDIPIGVYRNGCDSWMEPNLFHRDMQAGAPPDDFAIHGQNWGFPTYNWEQMARDDFAWWRRRFAQMSEYFDAFRIDHILGFFRIWSIPITSTQGIMGHFVPCQPVHVNEFGMRGINFDHFRYAVPYISSAVLQELFGNRANELLPYLNELESGLYELKDHLSTQQQIEAWFAEQPNGPATDFLRQGLLDLAANVLLFEVEGSQGTYYHFRFFMQHTASYRHLDDLTKKKLYELYIDYFFRRQDEFWKQEALQKLPALKRSTNMLICGEDLGLVPGCVPDVMQQLGILSLEIQRMPKKQEQEFFHPKDAPYLSVVTPSTHDMSTIRGWWEEDR
ncbi:MAG: 4-alpha-glucanotransferase, partial [Chitinophagaceae bacterium]